MESAERGEGGQSNLVEVLIVCCVVVAMVMMSFHSGGHIFYGAGSLIAVCLSIALLIFSGWQLWSAKRLRWVSLAGVMLPWCVYVLANSILLSRVPWDSNVELLGYGCAMLVFFSVLNLSVSATRGMFNGLLVVAGVVILFALLQWVIGASWHPIGGVNSVRAQYGSRLSSVFSMPNSFACFMLISLPYPMLKSFAEREWSWSKLGNGAVAVLMMFCLMASISRAAIIGGVLVFVLVCVLSGGGWKLRGLRLTGVLGVYVFIYWFVSSSGEAAERFSQLSQSGGEVTREVYFPAAASLFEVAPIWGVGVENFQIYWDRQFPVSLNHLERFAHSDYLQILCETGVVGFVLLFGAGFLVLLRAGVKLLRSNKGEKADVLVKASICGLLGFSLHELVNFETRVLCVLLVASVYFAVLVRFVSVERVVNVTKVGKLAGFLLIGGALFVFGGAVRLTQCVWSSSRGEFMSGRVFGFHSMGLPAPKEELLLAEQCFQRARELNPEYVPAYWYGARLRMSHRYYGEEELSVTVAESVALYDVAVKLCPYHWRLWADRAAVLALVPERLAEAQASFDRMLELAPDNARALEQYARFLERQGRHEELRDVLGKIVLIDDSYRSREFWPKEALLRLDEQS